ncbi:MAG TPA: hypothetical protein VK009_14890 [Chloroflexota bacterium]|nr:hypothetical protein [Chloroflexota bacterium]
MAGGSSAQAPRFGAIDVGSNTVHLLVAECDGKTLRAVTDESTRLGLGADVARGRAITPAKIAAAAATVRSYVVRAQKERAKELWLVGTQAVRAAVNGDKLAKEVERAAGLPLHVIEPAVEARLGCQGTTLDKTERTSRLIVDIGGGSTQLSFAAADGKFRFLGSLPVGSVALPTRYLLHDPPSKLARERLELAVREAVATLDLETVTHLQPEYGILIGGVGRRLARAGRLGSGEPLVRLWVERLVEAVMGVSGETMEVFGAARLEDVNMIRAGAVILREAMAAFELQYCRVSNNGIREGAILSMARGEDVISGH